MNYGSLNIDDYLTFTCNTHNATTGAATDADSAPAYRVYEDETATPVLTGTMALLDGSNTAGFYSEQIQITAANGFERGKCYNIYISAAVSSVTGTLTHCFQVGAAVDVGWWKTGVVATPSVTGVPEVDVTHWLGSAASAQATVADIESAVNNYAHSGTAQAGAAGTITLASGASSTDDFYNGCLVRITGGTGVGQRRWITDYTGSSRVAAVDSNWVMNPDATSTYEVL